MRSIKTLLLALSLASAPAFADMPYWAAQQGQVPFGWFLQQQLQQQQQQLQQQRRRQLK